METIAERRHRNFLVLLEEFHTQEINLPRRGLLRRFAKQAGMSEKYMSFLKTGRKQIGHATARQLEKAMHKPHGWMDSNAETGASLALSEDEFVRCALEYFRAHPERASKLITRVLLRN